MMKYWLCLLLAILAETAATTALKSSEQFTRLWPSVVVVVGYGLAFYFLSVTLKSIPIGIAYAVWSGIGIVLITLAGGSVLPSGSGCSGFARTRPDSGRGYHHPGLLQNVGALMPPRCAGFGEYPGYVLPIQAPKVGYCTDE